MIFDKNVCSRLSFDVERAEMSLQDTFSRFECGNASINKYLSENALSDDETVTYIYLDTDNGSVIGFASLACSGITVSMEGYRKTFPAVEIKYFALATEYQKMRLMDNEGFIDEHYYISDEIFANVVKKISDIAATIVGANKIVLYAVPSALGFYERNGFSSFLEYMEPDHTAYLDGCIPLYLDI